MQQVRLKARIAALLGAVLLIAGQAQGQGLLSTGNLTAANTEVTASGTGLPAVLVDVSGTFSGTITFGCAGAEGTYTTIFATSVTDGSTATTTTTTGKWTIPNSCSQIRARMTAYSSGTAVVTFSRAFWNARNVTFPNTAVASKGTGTATGPLSAVICTSTTLTGTIADTNETDIFTCTIPANTLSSDNKFLRMTVYGSFGNDANNKTLKAYWNGTNIATIGPTASTNAWRLELTVARSSSTNAKTKVAAVYGTTTTTGGNLAIVSDFTTALIIKVTGTNGTATAHDVDSDYGIVEALN